MDIEATATIDVNKMATPIGNLSGKVALITGMFSRKQRRARQTHARSFSRQYYGIMTVHVKTDDIFRMRGLQIFFHCSTSSQ